MAFDSPMVWILIVAVVVFLFGAGKIPQLARAVGQAKKEFESVGKDTGNNPAPAPSYSYAPQEVAPMTQPVQEQQAPPPPAVIVAVPVAAEDPLIVAARREGIDTAGKTREQIASELAWKLKGKDKLA